MNQQVAQKTAAANGGAQPSGGQTGGFEPDPVEVNFQPMGRAQDEVNVQAGEGVTLPPTN